MFLDTIIGHTNIKTQIINSIDNKRFSHAHIFSGEDGIGKGPLAKGIAIYLMKEKINKQYVDIIEFGIEKNKKTIGVDRVKSIIREINIKPYEKDKKVVIIHNADCMTIEAQNSFLKTIEEPPQGVFIFMLCENLENLLDTIKSRCQIYKLHHLTNKEMMEFLKREYSYLNNKEIETIVSFSDCIPGRAEKFIKDKSFQNIRNLTIDILKKLKNPEIDILQFENELMKYKFMWEEILTCFFSYIRDVFIYKETGHIDLIINGDKIDDVKGISEMFSINELNDIIDIIKYTRKKLDRNVNSALVFNSMLFKMQEV
ncbi:DNA polymerase III subunit delta' [Clostridium rectalis]|uniref:DNA polymerase III subunit delta' n=1 Tax=Clostridium rectalis TaxID=2040295 RepID=UPI000F63E086|nr:DNA polymerase III subunit delta' [Clostridium rectalis]